MVKTPRIAGAQTPPTFDPSQPLPANLPVPVDDGACDHLPGLAVPKIKLRSTGGGWVDLSALKSPRVIVYCYPRTGVPGQPLLPGGMRFRARAAARQRPAASAITTRTRSSEPTCSV
jgi:hypothetical protein